MAYKKTVMLMDEEKKNKLKIMILEGKTKDKHLYEVVDQAIEEYIQKVETQPFADVSIKTRKMKRRIRNKVKT